MKNLITTIASMIILFIFLMQFVANQMTYTKILGIEMAIKSFRREVEMSGHISETEMIQIGNRISEISGCDAEEISMEFQKKDQEGEIEYSVKVPIGDVIGASKLLQLNKEDNQFQYTSKGTIILRSEEDNTLP